ncbi:hybrid sensor histidine kinase/response regulator [Yunchengibacter salinarum]|uniref:hybrid sensor histidine kinase/response regulator n=1 Tax=Yunchengibacter salinarum TaxID=3133399 RepID=UPI0035B625BC
MSRRDHITRNRREGQRQLTIMMLIFTLGIVISGAVALWVVYRANLNSQRSHMTAFVHNQARLISSVAQSNLARESAMGAPASQQAAHQATIRQVLAARSDKWIFGDTGEFTLGERENGMIRFMLPSRFTGKTIAPIPMDGTRAEPMRRALSGETGTTRALDYRGNEVLAAYEYIPDAQLGIVAKIDISELYAPLIQAGMMLGGTLLAALLGSIVLVRRIGGRLVAGLDEVTSQQDVLFDNIPVGLYLRDETGRIIRANLRFKRIFDLSENELTTLGEEKGFLLNATFKKLWSEDIQTIKTGIGGRLETERDIKDGTQYLQATRVPVLDKNGEVVSVCGIVEDVTDRRKSEERLINAMEAAENANRAKSRFLANMSHELRTPMNSILGMGDLLSRTRLSEPQHKYVDSILSSGRLLTTILNDLLDLSKIEAGRVELETIGFRLSDVCQHVVDQSIPAADRKGVSLTFEHDGHVPDYVLGDPTRLQQVLLNLVNNAVKFTYEGEVTLAVTGTEKPVPTGTPATIHIEVQDTGIGIAPETMERLFEPFAQADAGTTRRFGGTGLGLAISSQLVDMMGGSLTVRSTVGVGSVFALDLNLPAADPDQVDVLDNPPAHLYGQNSGARLSGVRTIRNTPHPSLTTGTDEDHTTGQADSTDATTAPEGTDEAHLSGVEKGPGGHVLIAEDNENNTRLLEIYLDAAGYSHDTVDNGREAVRAAESGHYDLILMDVQMPVMDGMTATRAIRRKDGRHSRIPIIGLSANAMAHHRQEGLDAGMNAYLSKPLKMDDLLVTLEQHLAAAEAGN